MLTGLLWCTLFWLIFINRWGHYTFHCSRESLVCLFHLVCRYLIIPDFSKNASHWTITKHSNTVEPLLWGHPFCIRKVAFLEGWPLIRGKNQYIYIKIYIVKWPFQRGWPLIMVTSLKGFHCTGVYLIFQQVEKLGNRWPHRSIPRLHDYVYVCTLHNSQQKYHDKRWFCHRSAFK